MCSINPALCVLCLLRLFLSEIPLFRCVRQGVRRSFQLLFHSYMAFLSVYTLHLSKYTPEDSFVSFQSYALNRALSFRVLLRLDRMVLDSVAPNFVEKMLSLLSFRIQTLLLHPHHHYF